MYNNSPHTALRFSTIKPEYNQQHHTDLYCVISDGHVQYIPFQIRRITRGDDITLFKLVSINDAHEQDILSTVEIEKPYILNFASGYDIIIYKAFPLNITVGTTYDGGRYYVVISDGIETWYSLDILFLPCFPTVHPKTDPFDIYEDIFVGE